MKLILSSPMRRRRAAAILALCLMLAAGLTACKKPSNASDNRTPAGSVQGLLELRAQNSTDTAAYARHVETTGLAAALAADSANRPATDTPIPAWQPPKVTKESTSVVEVTVKWKPSKRFEGWPDETVFFLKKVKGKWLVFDARDAARSEETTGAP